MSRSSHGRESSRWAPVHLGAADLPPRRNTPLTYFPDTADGNRRFDYFQKVVSFHPIKHTLAQQQWHLGRESALRFAVTLFTFLYVDMIDCTATLYSMARFCNQARKSDKDFPRSTLAFCADAFCITVGSLLGCSPVTAFIESGAGIAEGGRTGLTAVVAGSCFLVSLFFAPVIASIPPWATGSTLILVRKGLLHLACNLALANHTPRLDVLWSGR